MRCLRKNMSLFYYALYEGKHPVYVTDEYGNRLENGEYRVTYSEPIRSMANISPASGATATEVFGSVEGYDKVILTFDTSCPIDEHSILWIDTLPTADGEPEKHDYIVKRVARSLNVIAIAVSKVDVQ